MLEYAARLTQQPWSMTAFHVESLGQAGFDDRDILHINMLADGLGVELEAFWEGTKG